MTAILAWARLDLRRRWRSLLVLTLLMALAGGVILAAVAGARRTDTVLTRVNAKTLPADAMVLPNKQGFDWSRVRSLPSVRTLGTFVLTEASPQGVGIDVNNTAGFPPGDLTESVKIDATALISGRLANPQSPTEIVVTPGFIGRYGRTVTLRFPTKAQTRGLQHGQDFPPGTKMLGQVVQLHVVGVGVNTFNLGPGGGPVYQPTHAYFTRYVKPLFPIFKNARVRLRGGEAAIPEFQKELAAATGDPNIQVDDWHEAIKPLQRTATFSAIGWLMFGGIALLASLILVGQAFVRFCAAATEDLQTLSALGMDTPQIRRAAAVGPTLATLVGVGLAVGIAIGASTLFPTSIVGRYEPNPGIRVDAPVLVVGSLAIIAIGSIGAWLCARLAIRGGVDPTSRPSFVAALASRFGLGVTAVLGTRFALEPGRGRTRVPVRPALIGAVAGVLGVVATLTFRVGLHDALANPAAFGQTFKVIGFVSENGPPKSYPAALAQAAKDPDIADLEDMRIASLSVNGRTTSTTSITPVRGHVPIVTLAGRPPTGPSEISLGPQTAHDLGVHVGSRVTVVNQPMTVTGITFVPQNPHNDYTDGAWLTTAAFNAVQPNESLDKFHEVRINFRAGVNQRAAIARLPKNLAPGGIGPSSQFLQPDEATSLKSLTAQPLLLSGFLIVLAIGAVGHGLATAVRRRRHDIAVLRSFGLTRWQTRRIVITQASVLAAVGLILGIPLGIAAGRTAWRVLADATPVYYVAPFAILGLLLAIPVTVAAANTLAALPARRAARMRVGDILRSE